MLFNTFSISSLDVCGIIDMVAQYGIVLVTASSRTEAEAIAHTLVEGKLAACVGLMPIHSVYTWKGDICSSDEWQLIIKTDLNQFDALAVMVAQVHSYEVPEIIALPIVAGSPSYLQWISQQIDPT